MSQIGNATVVSYCTTEGGTYTVLAQVTDASPPDASIDKVESTEYASAADTREYTSGVWIDNGDVDLELNYSPANSTIVYAQHGVQQWFQIILKDGSSWKFPGFLSKLGTQVPLKALVTQKVTIAVTGAVTFDDGL